MCQRHPHRTPPPPVPGHYAGLRIYVPTDTFEHEPILGPVELDLYLRSRHAQRRFEEERRRLNHERINALWLRAAYSTQV